MTVPDTSLKPWKYMPTQTGIMTAQPWVVTANGAPVIQVGTADRSEDAVLKFGLMRAAANGTGMLTPLDYDQFPQALDIDGDLFTIEVPADAESLRLQQLDPATLAIKQTRTFKPIEIPLPFAAQAEGFGQRRPFALANHRLGILSQLWHGGEVAIVWLEFDTSSLNLKRSIELQGPKQVKGRYALDATESRLFQLNGNTTTGWDLTTGEPLDAVVLAASPLSPGLPDSVIRGTGQRGSSRFPVDRSTTPPLYLYREFRVAVPPDPRALQQSSRL
ncbi:MAG: hypothetical protein ABI743_11185 [bacterium]